MTSAPLAERMRPKKLDEYVGQEHLVGDKGVIKQMIDAQRLSPFILWGPPGVGKTTLANLVAKTMHRGFYTLSAINAGVRDIRAVLNKAADLQAQGQQAPILFIDEIHRFSKTQQDALLGAVERGDVILIGATTENPSFEVISPLLSRCQVYTLKSLGLEELKKLFTRAVNSDPLLKKVKFEIIEEQALYGYAAGDARRFLNILELLYNARQNDLVQITNELVERLLQRRSARYDKDGELHYDIISAFIKSIRGSDPNAAIYWMARMIDAGEDPVFIARRLVILASEDIGLANPNALLLANAAFDAVKAIGMPEARIPLAQAAIYLASSPKSNACYMAINQALAHVRSEAQREVPLHLRNASTQLMKKLGYAEGYRYAHDYQGNFVFQEFLPEGLEGSVFYKPQSNPSESKIREWLRGLWREKYRY